MFSDGAQIKGNKYKNATLRKTKTLIYNNKKFEFFDISSSMVL